MSIDHGVYESHESKRIVLARTFAILVLCKVIYEICVMHSVRGIITLSVSLEPLIPPFMLYVYYIFAFMHCIVLYVEFNV